MKSALPILFLLAAPALAEPFVRWVDKTGGVKRAAVAAVLAEDAAQVKLRLADGSVLELPLRGLLRLTREDDRDPEQRMLLMARLGLEFGPIDDLAGLDQLVKNGKQPWIREYAAAARAVAAERAREKDAPARLKAFLEKYPRSRHRARVLVARARIAARGLTDPKASIQPFMDAFNELKGGDDTLLVRYGILVDATLRIADISRDEAKNIADSMAGALLEEIKEDAMAHLIAQSVFMDIRLAMLERARVHVEKSGGKPLGSLMALRKLELESGFLIAEVRFDLQYELGICAERCGRAEEAKKAYRASLKLAPDPYRRDRAAKKAGPQ